MSDSIFEKDFETGELRPIPIGRVILGGSTALLYMFPDGKVHMVAHAECEAYIHFSERRAVGLGDLT